MTIDATLQTSRQPFVPPPAPKTTKSAGTRRRLLDVAAELFVERGFAGVSMSDIATASELTKGAVYGHFRSKGQLLVEVIRWKIAEADHAPEFGAATADPWRGAGLLFDEERKPIRLLQLDAAAAARHDPDVALGLAELYGQRRERIRDAMGHVADPDLTAWLVGVLSFGIGASEGAGLPFPDEEHMRAALLAALAAPG